jgi:PAS domain S-box-containing protein
VLAVHPNPTGDESSISDRQLRAVVDTIPGLVWLARADGAAEYLNRRWLEYTGLSQSQAARWGWVAAIHPEDLDRLTTYWRSVFQSGVRGEIEARLRRFDGDYRWFMFSVEPLHDPSGAVVGWCGTNLDITEQWQTRTALERANRALEASEQQLKLIVETIPGFVWCASLDGRLTYVNQRLFGYIGAPAEDLWGQGWADFVHPDDRATALERWARSVATGAPLANQYRLRRFDGVYRWFHVPGQLGRDSDGSPTLWYGLLIDIDDRKSTEDALRRTETQLTRAAQTATVGELAAAIAHEVNQPLSAVVANAHACVRWLSAQPPNLLMAQQAAERIVRDGKDAGEVVRRVRALFKRAAPETVRVDINDVVGDVLNLLGRDAARRRVSLEHHLEGDLPFIIGDRVQLQHLLFNLFVNALEAMESIGDHAKMLCVTSRRDGPEALVVEIRDTGIGFAEPERAFEPFFSTKPNGMGMGLSICRSIVEAHQGVVWVAPVDEPGTTLCVRLPVEPKAVP